jgi:hypothetical protein
LWHKTRQQSSSATIEFTTVEERFGHEKFGVFSAF